MSSNPESEHKFVVVASRLPVDRVEGPDGEPGWQTSPGGLVTALEPVMREAGGAWIGWSGDAGPAPGAFGADGLDQIARRDETGKRAREIRAALGEPGLVLLGVDRLDYTKGILHRLRAYGELVDEGRLGPRPVLVQVASPSRERVQAYQTLRDEVEVMVGRINGQHGQVGYSPVHYLHQSYPREEMAALYLAADVMLVTPLRDGMNLVAKEYVATRYDQGGTLVLSEFTGAADELAGAFLVNPHDIEGLKNAIVRAATATTPAEARRRMRAMRRRVREHDVARWAADFLGMLRGASGERRRASAEARAAQDSRNCLLRVPLVGQTSTQRADGVPRHVSADAFGGGPAG
jgi:trehalose-6-phosphate synthase